MRTRGSPAPPRQCSSPLWLLGSSGYSAQVAGLLGLPFASAHHFSSRNAVPALDLYRRSFQPSDVLAQPYAMAAVRHESFTLLRALFDEVQGDRVTAP